jgi:hypothetical protein
MNYLLLLLLVSSTLAVQVDMLGKSSTRSAPSAAISSNNDTPSEVKDEVKQECIAQKALDACNATRIMFMHATERWGYFRNETLDMDQDLRKFYSNFSAETMRSFLAEEGLYYINSENKTFQAPESYALAKELFENILRMEVLDVARNESETYAAFRMNVHSVMLTKGNQRVVISVPVVIYCREKKYQSHASFVGISVEPWGIL